MKKIYFAGSIRGGRVDENLYREIIDYIQKTDKVLTEHVGNLSLSHYEGVANSEEDIYLEDTNWLKECDLVIAECSCPSLGVGYEMAYAEKLNKPTYIFHKKDVSLSAMLKGDKYFNIYPYEDKQEIFDKIDEILKRSW